MNRNLAIVAAKISRITGFTSLSYWLNRGKKRIIAYHNVIPDEYFDNSLHLAFSLKQSSFQKQIAILEERFKVDTDLDNSFSATITFDDGYLNQYVVAHKLMKEKNLTGYFFCAADLIMDQETLDVDQLQYWFSYVPAGIYSIETLEQIYLIKVQDNLEEREKEFYRFISNYNCQKYSCLIETLNKIYPFQSIEARNKDYLRLRFDPIPLEAIEEMKEAGQKIAPHSSKHEILSKLTPIELEEDIYNCANLIGSLYNSSVFCYPFGSMKDVGENVIKIVKEAKFRKALSFGNTEVLKVDSDNYNWFIPRMILPDTADKDLIHFYLSGATYLLKRRRTLP